MIAILRASFVTRIATVILGCNRICSTWQQPTGKQLHEAQQQLANVGSFLRPQMSVF